MSESVLLSQVSKMTQLALQEQFPNVGSENKTLPNKRYVCQMILLYAKDYSPLDDPDALI